MTATVIGHARCSTDKQGLTAQHDRLIQLGVATDRIYLDHFTPSDTSVLRDQEEWLALPLHYLFDAIPVSGET